VRSTVSGAVSDDDGVRARHWPVVALIGVLAFVAVLLSAVFGVVIPPPEPPAMPAGAPLAPAFTKHFLLVVVDGLRFDVASDPARMPHFSRALREDTGGELRAGRVSMTTSAVLAVGTGQRGQFEQIVKNVKPSPTPYDSWLEEAKAAGLSVMTVGDPAWVDMYGKSIDVHRLDPEGVAIDVDFNPETFRSARELLAKHPDVFVVHFVTPDHQAHAHTVPSKKYAEHIHGFDADLFRFLSEVPRDYTVVAIGDHGAADSGTHGADVPIQRKTVVFAYGPGIARGVHQSGAIDQVDLADTISVLLGLPPPRESRGHVLAAWLDAPTQARTRIACTDAIRSVDYARALGFTALAGELDTDVGACKSPAVALRVSRRVDAAIAAEGGFSSPWIAPLVALLGALALGTALLLLGRAASPAALAVTVVCACGVFLTWGVERLSGEWPLRVRIMLFVLGNVPALVLLVLPDRALRFARRWPALAPALVPGILVATYTTDAQPEAWVALLIAGTLFALRGGLTADPARARPGALDLLLFAACMALLFFPGTRESEIYPSFIRNAPKLTLGVALGLLALTQIVLALRAPWQRRLALGAAFALAAVLSLVLRRFAPPLLGRSAIVVLSLATVAFALRRQPAVALSLGVVSYAWISRDAEIIAFSSSILLAHGVGHALARQRERRGRSGVPLSLPNALLTATFLFGVVFVQRVGLHGAIDFGAMDWGVAGFGDPHVSAWVVGTALGLKYALAAMLVVAAFGSALGPAASEGVLAAAFLVFLARGAVLAAMFLLSGQSFWTGLRVMGDLPFALIWALTVALSAVALRYTTKVRAL
jgi:Type I phosphodiesterase / nucleotide pyrophosphatase